MKTKHLSIAAFNMVFIIIILISFGGVRALDGSEFHFALVS